MTRWSLFLQTSPSYTTSWDSTIGSWGDMNGVLTNPNLLGLRPGPATGPRELRRLWLRVGQLQAPPPRNLSGLLRPLEMSQRKGLEKALSRRRETKGPQQMGSAWAVALVT